MGLKANLLFLARQFPFVYPSAIISSCEQWIKKQEKQKGRYYAQRGPWYKNVFPEGFINNPPPQTCGSPNEKAFYNNRSYPTAKAGLFYLHNCYLFGHKGVILSKRNEVFQEFSHHFGIATLKKFLQKQPFYLFTKNEKKINGTGAVLVSPESHNYYHWLSDVLPRIRLYEEVLDQVDHFCIASNVPQKFLDVLTEFGIPKERICFVNEKEKLHFDHLYVSSLPGSEGRSPQWAVDYLRSKLIKVPADGLPAKNIYFKRGANANRKILNEDVIITDLAANGFEIIDPDELSLYEQVGLMQQARIVVGAHGAALSNLVFCREGAAVIELFSPDYFRTDCYYTLASILKLNYYYLTAYKPVDGKWGDSEVDGEMLKKCIDRVVGSTFDKFNQPAR
jgi:hypothetical protein